jgi:hypothetical protein
MDYDYILNKVFTKAEYFIIKQFKDFKNDDRTYTYSIDKICGIISTKTFYSFLGRNRDVFENCQRIFNNPQHYYIKEVPLSKIINNEIKDEFHKTLKHQKPVDNKLREIENYKFSSFVYELIVYETLMKIERRLRQNNDLYKLIYESEEYSSITLESFDGHVINSILYQKLYAKVYPNEKTPVAIVSINQYGNEEWSIKFENNSITKTSDELKNNDSTAKKPLINTTIFNISKFSDDEKIFLLHVYKSTKLNIPWTEYAKLMIITGGLKDLSIFDEGSVNNRFYDKLNKGIDYYGKSTQRDFINQIIEKMEPFGLSNINKAISIIKISIK